MPSRYRIIEARAEQTQAVWDLNAAFTVNGLSRADHAATLAALRTALPLLDTAEIEEFQANNAVDTREAELREIILAAGQRIDSEVPDDDPAQRRVDQIRGMPSRTGEQIRARVKDTLAFWEGENTRRAALTPPLPAIVVRQKTAAQVRTLFTDLTKEDGLDQKLEEKSRDRATKEAEVARHSRKLDRGNKDWHQAWKAEYTASTNEGAALAGVDTETGVAAPEVLAIASVTQQGVSLRVQYDVNSGDHATVRQLLYKVAGVDSDYRRVPADREAGNLIGPFIGGAVVTLRTDVGNSRDHSELGPEQTVTIASVHG